MVSNKNSYFTTACRIFHSWNWIVLTTVMIILKGQIKFVDSSIYMNERCFTCVL